MADDRHHAAAARARGVVRLQRHLDPRQVRRQRAAVGPALGRPRLLQRRIAPLRFGLALGDGLLEVLQAELQLLLEQTFGPGAELQAPELEQQVPQPVVLRGQGVPLGGNSVALSSGGVSFSGHAVPFGPGRQQQRPQRVGRLGQRGQEGR